MIVVDLHLEGVFCLRDGANNINNEMIRIRGSDLEALRAKIRADGSFALGQWAIKGGKRSRVEVVTIQRRMWIANFLEIIVEVGCIAQIETNS